jgi:hypothetical protein
LRYTVAYAEPRLSRPVATPTPADEGRGDPAHRGRCGKLDCRIIGRSASDPLGPHCSTSSGYGGPIRDQPPARTRVVLRSAAQPQNAATLKTSEDSQAMLIATHRLASMLGTSPGHTAKTRHQKRPAETGGRNGASIAEFRTRRPAHICETSRYRAVFERPSYVTR